MEHSDFLDVIEKVDRKYRLDGSFRGRNKARVVSYVQEAREVFEDWENPDSPEAFAASLYQLRRIWTRDRKALTNTRPSRRRSPARSAAGGRQE